MHQQSIKSRRKRRTFVLRAYDIAPNSYVKLSWGTQMPKLDKKENIAQLEGNTVWMKHLMRIGKY